MWQSSASLFVAGAAGLLGLVRLRWRAERVPAAKHDSPYVKQLLHGYPTPAWLDVCVSETDPKQREVDMRAVVRALCEPEWAHIEDSDVEIVTLQGGLTNQLYLLRARGGTLCALVRIYGQNTEVLIDREEESVVFHILSCKGFGPTLYGLFQNGRVEGFIESTGLKPSDMGQRDPVNFARLVSRELARMHYLDMPLARDPYLWAFLHKFAKMTADIAFPSKPEDQAKLTALNLPRIRERLARLETELPSAKNAHGAELVGAAGSDGEREAMAFLFESVFCHNDLLAGNLLYVEPEKRVQFIDFEYGKYNYRGFDIANHFCEYAGFDFDLARWYPDASRQRYFIEQYIAAGAERGEGDLKALHKRLQEDKAFDAAFFTSCVAWVDKFAVASNTLWGLWSLIQKLYSPIDFDYLDYARLRLTAVK